jgi:hypothetical protein
MKSRRTKRRNVLEINKFQCLKKSIVAFYRQIYLTNSWANIVNLRQVIPSLYVKKGKLKYSYIVNCLPTVAQALYANVYTIYSKMFHLWCIWLTAKKDLPSGLYKLLITMNSISWSRNMHT